MLDKNNTKPYVAIINFDAYVGLYAETLRYIAWKLRHNGCRVVRVGCDGVFGACTSFNSFGAVQINSGVKDAICNACKKSQLKISSDSVNNISRYKVSLDQDSMDFLNEVTSRLKKQPVATSVLDMSYLGFYFCKIAFFDFSIQLKLSFNSQLNHSEISRFVDGVKDLILLKNHMDLLVKSEQLTHIVYVNGNYSSNTLINSFCRNKKITCLSVEPQFTSHHILNHIFLKKDRLELAPEALLEMNSKYGTDPKFLRNVINTFGSRISGHDFNAYTSLDIISNNQKQLDNIKSFFDRYKRVHSFFMSSEDEMVPHKVTHNFSGEINDANQIFYKNQFEFTDFYLREAANNPDVGFILRVHPRMAINKRDAFESREHVRYKNLFKEIALSPNVLILLGDNKISSYFLIKKSNLVIVSWSTIGLEALMMGVPVVSAFPNHLMYPLNKISKQPLTFGELKRALFFASEYGTPNDIILINWISMAYEGQFFPTLAPRSNRKLGLFYRLIYRFIDKIGCYKIFAYGMDKLIFGNIAYSNEFLLENRRKEIPITNELANLSLLRSYRGKLTKILNLYQKKLFKEI